jgi:hypothetical protein
MLLEKALDQRQWTNQKLMERRFAVFDKMAPALNDLYCLLSKVGSWKEIKPAAAISSKRLPDRGFILHGVVSRSVPRGILRIHSFVLPHVGRTCEGRSTAGDAGPGAHMYRCSVGYNLDRDVHE